MSDYDSLGENVDVVYGSHFGCKEVKFQGKVVKAQRKIYYDCKYCGKVHSHGLNGSDMPYRPVYRGSHCQSPLAKRDVMIVPPNH